MYSRLQKKFGTAGLVVAVVALIAALAGVAFAAAGLNPKQKKEVKKIAQQYAGKNGATGPAGPAGPQGPKGDPGAAGATGADGVNGANGAAGATGATGTTGATGATGTAGTAGAKGATGATGPTGPEGVCSTSTCTLPSGATERGAWSFGPIADTNGGSEGAVNAGEIRIPISFPISLAAIISEGSKIHIFEGTSIPSGCTGTVESGNVIGLGAAAGHFCVYLRQSANMNNQIEEAPATPVQHLIVTSSETASFSKTGKSGAFLTTTELNEGARANGTWAVTAP